MAQKGFKGAAVVTTLGADITSGSSSLTIASATGWPDGSSSKPFVLSVGGTEKILCASRSGTTCTVTTRGYDDTTAAAHTAGEEVKHVLDASTVQEANTHVNDITVDNHTQYLNTTRHDLTTRHTVGTVLPAGTTPSDVTTSASVGSANTVARGDHAHKVGTGAINSAAMFAAGVVDPAALASNAVTTVKITDVNVTTAKIADLNVTQGKLAAAVTQQIVQIVTSSTRPGSPTEGQAIYETDTNRYMTYDGANWRFLSSYMAGPTSRTSGDVTITTTTSTVDSSLDLTVPCVAGDKIVLGCRAVCNSPNGANLYLDFVTVNNTTETNYASGTALASSGQGVAGIYAVAASTSNDLNVTWPYTVVAGDVYLTGTKFRLKAKAVVSSGTIYANTLYPLRVWAINYGQMA